MKLKTFIIKQIKIVKLQVKKIKGNGRKNKSNNLFLNSYSIQITSIYSHYIYMSSKTTNLFIIT